jgi:hypothetical protein
MADFAPLMNATRTVLSPEENPDRNKWVEGVEHPWNSKAASMAAPSESNVWGAMPVPTPGPRGRGKSEWLTKR